MIAAVSSYHGSLLFVLDCCPGVVIFATGDVLFYRLARVLRYMTCGGSGDLDGFKVHVIGWGDVRLGECWGHGCLRW